MAKKEVVDTIKKDEADGNGAIISIGDEEAVYLDFDTDVEIPFRYIQNFLKEPKKDS